MVARERVVGKPVTWTGQGFMRATEGNSIEFIVDDIPKSMEYNIVIRYESQVSAPNPRNVCTGHLIVDVFILVFSC